MSPSLSSMNSPDAPQYGAEPDTVSELNDMSVVVLASRESLGTLEQTLRCAIDAVRGRATVDVLVNGNTALAKALSASVRVSTARRPRAPNRIDVRVWSLDLGDKANAWNHYVHDLWVPANATFFVDGYARVRLDALSTLAAACVASPVALAATGVPAGGRSAARLRQQMVAEGGLHGNLFMLTRAAMTSFRTRQFRLPVGLYRTDSTIGAALAFGMDPLVNAWSPLRFIAVSTGANWDVDAQSWWSYSALVAQMKRRRRQAQGDLENAAVRRLFAVEKQPPESLPPTVEQLVLEWVDAQPQQAAALLRRSRLRQVALERLRAGLRAGPFASRGDARARLVCAT